MHEDGTPAPYFGLMIQENSEPTYMSFPIAVRDAKGEFHFQAVEAGTWKVVVVGPGFVTAASGDLTLVDGKTIDAGAITVKRGNEVTGVVTDSGKPAVDAKVCAEKRRGGLSMGGLTVDGKPLADRELLSLRDGKQCAVTDARGRYVVRGIADPEPPMIKSRPAVLGVRVELGDKAGFDTVGFAKAMTLDLTLIK